MLPLLFCRQYKPRTFPHVGARTRQFGWDPSPTLVAEAEARLPAFVIRHERAPKSLDDYYRQYLWVVIGDEKLIYCLRVFVICFALIPPLSRTIGGLLS